MGPACQECLVTQAAVDTRAVWMKRLNNIYVYMYFAMLSRTQCSQFGQHVITISAL
jgi:hypothetical protein